MKDLRSKVEELEASGGRRLKSQVSSLEAKIAGLEEQLDTLGRWLTAVFVLLNIDG